MFRSLIPLFFLCFCANHLNAQTEPLKYDSTLAATLGADDYGMKMYVFVILKTGSNKTKDKQTLDSLFSGHMDNIGRLAKNGQLIVAGPFEKNEREYRGIFILNAADLDAAKLLLDTDPAIKAGLFDTEMYQWYGSAALPQYLPFHDMVQKKKF